MYLLPEVLIDATVEVSVLEVKATVDVKAAVEIKAAVSGLLAYS
jgi:hypothetical protein